MTAAAIAIVTAATAAAAATTLLSCRCNLNCIKAFEKEEQELGRDGDTTSWTGNLPCLMLKVMTLSLERDSLIGAAPEIMRWYANADE